MKRLVGCPCEPPVIGKFRSEPGSAPAALVSFGVLVSSLRHWFFRPLLFAFSLDLCNKVARFFPHFRDDLFHAVRGGQTNPYSLFCRRPEQLAPAICGHQNCSDHHPWSADSFQQFFHVTPSVDVAARTEYTERWMVPPTQSNQLQFDKNMQCTFYAS